jgi:copper homeostasis protein
MSEKILEVMVGNIESMQEAINGGAMRIELCSNPENGGTTPSAGYFLAARKMTKLPIFVLIRPHSGDFKYNLQDLESIYEDIKFFRENGADGIVCGCLTENREVDFEITKKMVELSHPLPFTFHRAIDDCIDIEKGVEMALKAGCQRVLSSGGKEKAIDGIEMIEKLITKFGDQISIMPGSGINSENVLDFINIGANEVHASASSSLNFSKDKNQLFYRKSVNVTDAEKVKAIINKIK